MANDDNLPERIGKAERREAQDRAARAERVPESFSVPDRFAERRGPNGPGTYDYHRE